MKIEVALHKTSSTKERGDLLESLTEKLLSAQSYEVIKEIRFTALELDLLCRHKVSGKEIYVECKAYRDKNIDANILKNLAGTLFLKDYSEAWIVSTGEYGKEAKGFAEEWKAKPKDQATKLSFYDPEKVVASLISSGIIKRQPEDRAAEYMGSENLIGEWVLLVTSYGIFWAVATLSGGIPAGVLCYYAKNNELVKDAALLSNIADTDTTLNNLNFNLPKSHKIKPPEIDSGKSVSVVQVQTGEAWSDYRPARPEDFVGRVKDIRYIFDFFRNIKEKNTSTRIFAITGNSGMGKSSLIAKLKSKARNYQNKHKYFVFPVDIRAATGPDYIYSSLLEALKSAQEDGFGEQGIDLVLSDVGNPLNSETIKRYLESLDQNGQLIALVFDQFEELYSKPELYEVFEKAKSLLLSAAAMKLNFCLGFAWKTDSTTHSEHPAYFFWHQLSDYRVTRKLAPFSDRESNTAINIFEKEIQQKLHHDLRHNLVASSQGYPWLLKKLCIHLYEKMESGIDQYDLLENKLDVASLFREDMDALSPAESSCLKLIAQRAPVDWFEIIELSGPDTLKSLINRRLVIRSGDRLNIYWDIFREYVLTGSVPVIPLRYLPSTDFSSLFKVVSHLEHDTKLSVQDLVTKTRLSEGTVQNIGSDMVMFGVAIRESGLYSLSKDVAMCTEMGVLRAIREKFFKHAFTHAVKDKSAHSVATVNSLVESLKQLYPDNKYADKTWHAYTVRLCRWLELCGFIENTGNGWIYRDQGDVVTERAKSERRRRKSNIFTAPASPGLALETLNWLIKKGSVDKDAEKPKGYRNALSVLKRFELIYVENDMYMVDIEKVNKFPEISEAIWISANLESVLLEVVRVLESDVEVSGKAIGEYIAEKHDLNWTEASKVRNGGAIRQWALWLFQGKLESKIPICPGRT
ncbi:restriction endonuclease [Halomonas sp. McH1-25]|uniref:restriction endonuclease n=1 Tax=unclassified Halomonas TaxID=2609666 RepID=UPI001EF4701B|nr:MULTISPECIES: restriction endonuclease [unclassified Halomonas]MCG7602065.1 restriction endonuclease [Halomonas sp. McH1-25]MCP1342901.1 restriction endonuclease [Halomonas sp. FL8]MCP1362520.1 restriction endonuclease [Halomonas sp. BBD45]MCP1363643.1 restriction endonuclease [Halomonas sp. BBD48]